MEGTGYVWSPISGEGTRCNQFANNVEGLGGNRTSRKLHVAGCQIVFLSACVTASEIVFFVEGRACVGWD